MPFLAAAAPAISAAASVAGAGASIAGAALSGGGGGGGRLKLPGPEEEIAYIRRTQKDLRGIDSDIERTKTLEATLRRRLDASRRVAEATIPKPEDLAELNRTTMELAKSFAGGAAEAVKRGFMTQADADAYEEMKGLEEAGFEDLALKQQFADDRVRLEASLRKANASPSQIQNQLARFDAQAQAMMQSRAEELRTAKLGRITTREASRLGMREQTFSEALRGYGAATGELGRAREGSTLLANLAGVEGQIGLEGLKTRSALRGEAENIYAQMGQFDFSKQGKQALESGLVGPGTMYEQTGVPRKYQGSFRDMQKGYERQQYGESLGGYAQGNIEWSPWETTYTGESPTDYYRRRNAAQVDKGYV